MRHSEQRTHGFTLVELLVVMALIALAAALTVPKLNTRHYSPGQFAESLSSYLNAASANADNRGDTVCVSKSAEQITVTPAIQQALPIPKDLEVTMNQICFEKTGIPQSPIEVAVRSAESGSPAILVKSEGVYGKVKVMQ